MFALPVVCRCMPAHDTHARSLQPGWDCQSWAYYSDDGLFMNRNQAHDRNNPIIFGPGDTVGCALVYDPLYEDVSKRYKRESVE